MNHIQKGHIPETFQVCVCVCTGYDLKFIAKHNFKSFKIMLVFRGSGVDRLDAEYIH